MTSSRLINERPLLVLPSLVHLFNGNYTKAILLQQIHFMVQQPKSGTIHDGHKWIWFTYEEFQESTFTWLSVAALRKSIKELESDGYIVSTSRIKDRWDATKFYRLDYPKIAGTQVDDDMLPQYQKDMTADYHNDMAAGGQVLYTETSTETSAEKHPRRFQRQTAAAEHTLKAKEHGLDAKQFTILVQEWLICTGNAAIADQPTPEGDRALATGKSNAITGLGLGIETPEDVQRRYKAFVDDHPSWGYPSYMQLMRQQVEATAEERSQLVTVLDGEVIE